MSEAPRQTFEAPLFTSEAPCQTSQAPLSDTPSLPLPPPPALSRAHFFDEALGSHHLRGFLPGGGGLGLGFAPRP